MKGGGIGETVGGGRGSGWDGQGKMEGWREEGVGERRRGIEESVGGEERGERFKGEMEGGMG